MGDEDFYKKLEGIRNFAEATEPSVYVRVPASWLLVITDVQGSTDAIEAGRYRDVNALGVASIVAVNNALQDVALPYVFGGDGATLLVPGSRREDLETCLRGLRDTAKSGFDMTLRVGVVPVDELLQAGHAMTVTRYHASDTSSFAMFAGDGFSVGERWVKDPEVGGRYEVRKEGPAEADYSGFECRWRPLQSDKGVVLSVLVQARAGDLGAQSEIYRGVLAAFAEILDHDEGCPVHRKKLRLGGVFNGFGPESRLKSKRRKGVRLRFRQAFYGVETAGARIAVAAGITSGGFNGATYPDDVVKNSDFRKFDDTLRMVIDVSENQAEAIEAFLESSLEKRRLFYGVHRSTSALMTCNVSVRGQVHVHFIDGNDGGYALAAKELKARIKAGS